MNQFTLIQARKTKVGGCWAQIFCGCCSRGGSIRLVLENKQTQIRELLTIHYNYDREINIGFKKIIDAFQTASNQGVEPSEEGKRN